MLRYLNSHSTQYVKVGAYMRGIPTSGNTFFTSIDPFPGFFQGQLVDLGWYPAHYLVGHFNPQGGAEEVDVWPSSPHEANYDAVLDLHRYGSRLSGFAAASSLLRNGTVLGFDPSNEHPVVHRAMKGLIGPAPADDLYKLTSPAWDTYIKPAWWSISPALRCRNSWNKPALAADAPLLRELWYGVQNSLYRYSVDLKQVEDAAWGPIREVRESLPYFLADNFPLGFNLGIGKFAWTSIQSHYLISNLQIDWGLGNGYGFRLAYHIAFLEAVSGADQWIQEWDAEMTFSFQPVGIPASKTAISQANTWIQIQNPGIFVESWKYTMTRSHPTRTAAWFGSGVGVGTVWKYDYTNTWYLFLSRAVEDSGETAGNLPKIDSFRKTTLQSSFFNRVEKEMSSIRLSSLQSTADAFSSGLGSIDTNLIEALVELREVQEMLPDFRAAALVVQSASSLRFLGTIASLMSLASSLVLVNAFAWGPTYELLSTGVTKIRKALDVLERLTRKGVYVGRGSFTYDFPLGEFGREESSLTARTKVVVGLDQRVALSRVLGVQALGLLPSPDTFWDLVPMSFVLDWFSGIGNRISDIQQATLGSMLNNVMRYVHTYRVTSLLTQAELDAFNFTPSTLGDSAENAPRLAYFVRDVSQHPPRIADGRYDFRLPGRWPPWLTAAALAWSLLTSR